MSFVIPSGVPGAGRTLRSAFIVGAPRCGTTFLAKALGRHPQICFSKPKETHFFALSWASMPPDQAAREFLRRYFHHLSPEHVLIGEASPSHLYEPEIAERIAAFDPEARIVVAVRNPIDMVYSLHARMLYLLEDDVTDFARAWELQEARARGQHIPKRSREPRMLQYREMGCVADRIERLFAAVGRDRCHVVVYDDLAADPIKTYRDLLEFVGVAYDGRTEFARKNENREFESVWVQQFVTNPPWPISLLAVSWQLKGWKRPQSIKAFRRWVQQRNTRRAARPPLSPEMRESLRITFAPEVEHLGRLLGRDLSQWR